ncbi:MAG: hypothetical protein AB7G75_25775 [Candidatus Binatia bacterium]
MPTKDIRQENPARSEMEILVKRVERFLRLLTWQMFFLLALLLYMALRPQAGRYQFTVAGEDVGVFDTSNSRAWMIKLDRKVQQGGKTTEARETVPPQGEKTE